MVMVADYERLRRLEPLRQPSLVELQLELRPWEG
jgi:hypothetical protein